MTTDTERLDWLEKQDGEALLSDDGGRWAVSSGGVQNVPDEQATDISTMFFVAKKDWHKSVRDAIDAKRRAINDPEP